MTIFEILDENGGDYPWFTLEGWEEAVEVDADLAASLQNDSADWTDTLKIIDHGAWLAIEETDPAFSALTRTVGYMGRVASIWPQEVG